MKFVVMAFKALKRLRLILIRPFDTIITRFVFLMNGVKFSTFNSIGWPFVNVQIGGKCDLGRDLTMNNRFFSNPIGRFSRCSIVVGPKGNLIVGRNVGMSSCSIVCHEKIIIGNHVNLGGNVVIYDTDFHSLNAADRMDAKVDEQNTQRRKVVLCDGVFVGAHVTILKGVTIGENSIIGAGSVVTKDVPPNEVWAGNPAKFVRKFSGSN
jgi:acetyltransferase-like isoleucine patch superfamily enzyme